MLILQVELHVNNLLVQTQILKNMKKEEYISPLMKVFFMATKRPLLQTSLGAPASADNLNEASDYDLDW